MDMVTLDTFLNVHNKIENTDTHDIHDQAYKHQ